MYTVIELGRGNHNAQGPGPLVHMFIYNLYFFGQDTNCGMVFPPLAHVPI